MSLLHPGKYHRGFRINEARNICRTVYNKKLETTQIYMHWQKEG